MRERINVTQAIAPDETLFASHMGDILRSHNFSNNGAKVLALEAALKEFLGVKYIALCANGTLGLEMAIRAAGAAHQTVVTTPFTYVATVSAALWNACEVLFADIDEETLCMDPAKLEPLISEKVKAILPVDVYSHPCDFDAIAKMAGDIPVIYDAAHAFGARMNGCSLFNFGNFSVCSLHATKVFHTFEGGFVVCHTERDWQELNLLRAFGHIQDVHYSLGVNAKMSEVHAAAGLSLLGDFMDHLEKRNEISQVYDSLLDFSHLRKPLVSATGFESNYGYYPLIFETEKTLLKAMAELRIKNIHPRRYFYPALNLLPYVARQSCPVAESIAPRLLCLPLYSGLELGKAAEIAEIVNVVIR